MTELNYIRSGDYLLPDLRLNVQKNKPPSKYGRVRKAYLKEHRPVLFVSLLISEKLYPHLAEIDQTANSRLEQMMPKLMKAVGIAESLKMENPIQWIGLMNNCKAQEEVIIQELVCC